MDYSISALNILLEALEYEPDLIKKADIQKKIGDIYCDIAQFRERKENSKKAIMAYEESLKIYTLEQFPMYYAMIQNNLGNANSILANVEDKAENCRKAIMAYEKSLKVRTLEQFPMDYVMTQENLGNAYSMLADVEDNAENCRKANLAYEESLKVKTKKISPDMYQFVEKNSSGLNEYTQDEIFNERAYYLFNMDELLLERLGEQIGFRTSFEMTSPEQLSKRKIQLLSQYEDIIK